MKRIGVLSAGTDNPGINCAIRAITRSALHKGYEVFAVHHGFRGLVEDHLERLTTRSVSGIIGKPGAFIGSSIASYIKTPIQLQTALNNMNKRSIDNLIVIGGSGSFKESTKFVEKGKHVIGIPSTVQDDIVGTDICLGVDSCVNTIMECVDHIRSCDSSRNRSFLVEVAGIESGSIALRSGIVTGCEFVLTPDKSLTTKKELEDLAHQIEKVTQAGKTQCICIISKGWKPGIKALSQCLSDIGESDLHVRETILGHLMRGGQPTAYDRILGTYFGNAATKAIVDGHTSEFVALQGNKIVMVPFEKTIGAFRSTENLETLFNNTNL